MGCMLELLMELLGEGIELLAESSPKRSRIRFFLLGIVFVPLIAFFLYMGKSLFSEGQYVGTGILSVLGAGMLILWMYLGFRKRKQ